MTPEERAAKFVHDITGLHPVHALALNRKLAAAMRQAENEALERAVKEADQIENSFLAARIRALKHPD